MADIKKISIHGTDYDVSDKNAISLYPLSSFSDRKKSNGNYVFVLSSEDNTPKIKSALQILSDSVGGLK